MWTYTTSIPIYSLNCSCVDNQLAIHGKIDNLVRIVGPKTPLQYLRHSKPILFAQWNNDAVVPDVGSMLLTLDSGGILRLWSWCGNVLVQCWVSQQEVIAAQWITRPNQHTIPSQTNDLFGDEAIAMYSFCYFLKSLSFCSILENLAFTLEGNANITKFANSFSQE